MKASPLLISWHNDKSPIYSVQFEPRHGKGRLATAGGDNNVRIWKVEHNGNDRQVTYLSTLSKHTQAVNVVRWCPRGELLASAGDDGNIILWTPTDKKPANRAYGEDDGSEDKEWWNATRIFRSNTSNATNHEIYDLAWSPDGNFLVTGSMDNVTRIYDASTGTCVRQIAEHNNYVQGVAWDPLNEYIATQSSDRSIHIYKLRTNDGQFTLTQHNKVSRMDLPLRRPSSNSPAPPDFGHRSYLNPDGIRSGSPAPSMPGTPQSLAPFSMNPPLHAPSSRRSSFGAGSPGIHRSQSPAPAMPLPAVMPSASPLVGMTKTSNIYASEALASFFRRLTFAPDGSLLFTPAGQYKNIVPATDGGRATEDVTNTVYIYSRGGLNKPPIAHLPGHKKPSVAVRCCGTFFNLRPSIPTKNIAFDTSNAMADEILPLPEPVIPSKLPASASSMEPPATKDSGFAAPATPKPQEGDVTGPPAGPPSAFALPYRIVYAVATQDAVYVYDTQQTTPLCIVSNLHFATFTDLAWSNDGTTLIMCSSDGFCSTLAFSPGELGTVYTGPLPKRSSAPSGINTSGTTDITPMATPTAPGLSSLLKQASGSNTMPSPSPIPSFNRPTTPSRTNSNSSVATSHSFQHGGVISNPTPSMSNLPSVSVANVPSSQGHSHHGHGHSHSTSQGSISVPFQPPPPPALTSATLTNPTPPMTPQHVASASASTAASFPAPPDVPMADAEGFMAPLPPTQQASVKRDAEREGEEESEGGVKKRRIAPTLIGSGENGAPPPS